MNNDNKVETAVTGLNCWDSYATGWLQSLERPQEVRYTVILPHIAIITICP